MVQRFGTVGAAANTANSIYFQDRWQPTSRLTINAGVRMEKEDLPSFNGYAPPINFGWGDKIVPRLGVAYDLTGDGQTKLFGSFNKFQDRLKFELPRGSFGGDFYRNDYFEIMPNQPNYDFYTLSRIIGSNQDVLGGQCPIPNSTGLSRCQYDFRIASNDPNADIYTGKVDPDLEPFTQTEFTAGLEREIARSMVLSFRYTRKSWTTPSRTRDSRRPKAARPTSSATRVRACTPRRRKQFGYAKTTTPERIYNAFETRIDRRFADNFQFQVAYTYSKLEGNYSGLASSDETGRTSLVSTASSTCRTWASRPRAARQRPPGDRSSARLQRVRLVPVQLVREDRFNTDFRNSPRSIALVIAVELREVHVDVGRHALPPKLDGAPERRLRFFGFPALDEGEPEVIILEGRVGRIGASVSARRSVSAASGIC